MCAGPLHVSAGSGVKVVPMQIFTQRELSLIEQFENAAVVHWWMELVTRFEAAGARLSACCAEALNAAAMRRSKAACSLTS